MNVGPTERTVAVGIGLGRRLVGRLRRSAREPPPVEVRRGGLGRRVSPVASGAGLIGLPCASTRGCDNCRARWSFTTMSPCSTVVSSMFFSACDQALAGALATAALIERRAIAERIRQRRVGLLAADRHRLVDVLARIAVGIELHLGGRAGLAAGLFVLGKARRRGGGRDRIIEAVAGAHADGAEGAARRRWRRASLLLPGVKTDFGPNSDSNSRRCAAAASPPPAAGTAGRNCSAPAPPGWRGADLRARAPASPRSRSMSAWMRSRLSRICWILLLSGPHCADWPLNSTKKLFFSQPARCAAASWRSISACWLAAASSNLRSWSARAASLPLRSNAWSWASSREQHGFCCACAGCA